MKVIVKRWTIQQPVEQGIPWIASILLQREFKMNYKIGVGMTPEEAVADLANKTSFWAGVLLTDWHPFLRKLMLPDAASNIRLPAEMEDHSDHPF